MPPEISPLNEKHPDEKHIENYDEERLLSLESPAFSVKYGKDLMRKYPHKFDFVKMIFNLSENARRINEVAEYVANTADIIKFIFTEMTSHVSQNDHQYLLHALAECFEMDIKFPPEFLEEVFSIIKSVFNSTSKNFATMKEIIADISNKYTITEDQFFEFSDIIDFKRIDPKVNDWANPWKASERLRLYVLLNNLD